MNRAVIHACITFETVKSFFARYERKGIDTVDSTVLMFDDMISIGFREAGLQLTGQWPLRDLQSSYSRINDETVIHNINAAAECLYVPGEAAHRYITERQTEMAKPWYKKQAAKHWARNGTLLLSFVALLFVAYLVLVPWVSGKLASRVPTHTERQMGDAVYNAMGLEGKEDSVKSMLLNEFFASMGYRSAYAIRITVIKDDVVNAFALPGGRIVVYSSLLDRITSSQELAALLSHEFIHIDHQHTTKSIFRRLGSKVFLSLVFGRFGALTGIVADHADDLKSFEYSRKLEKEADIDGAQLMTDHQMDANGFIELLQHLKKESPDNGLEILASHPDIDKRINYLEKIIPGTGINKQEQLDLLFRKIKADY